MKQLLGQNDIADSPSGSPKTNSKKKNMSQFIYKTLSKTAHPSFVYVVLIMVLVVGFCRVYVFSTGVRTETQQQNGCDKTF
jgi:preprotein translocase subunit SecY